MSTNKIGWVGTQIQCFIPGICGSVYFTNTKQNLEDLIKGVRKIEWSGLL